MFHHRRRRAARAGNRAHGFDVTHVEEYTRHEIDNEIPPDRAAPHSEYREHEEKSADQKNRLENIDQNCHQRISIAAADGLDSAMIDQCQNDESRAETGLALFYIEHVTLRSLGSVVSTSLSQGNLAVPLPCDHKVDR